MYQHQRIGQENWFPAPLNRGQERFDYARGPGMRDGGYTVRIGGKVIMVPAYSRMRLGQASFMTSDYGTGADTAGGDTDSSMSDYYGSAGYAQAVDSSASPDVSTPSFISNPAGSLSASDQQALQDWGYTPGEIAALSDSQIKALLGGGKAALNVAAGAAPSVGSSVVSALSVTQSLANAGYTAAQIAAMSSAQQQAALAKITATSGQIVAGVSNTTLLIGGAIALMVLASLGAKRK